MRKVSVFVAIILTIATLAIMISAFLLPMPERTPVDDAPALSFNEEGHFRILHLSDFHEWMGIERNSLSVETQKTLKPRLTEYVNKVLDIYKPDLVVLGGDNIFSLKLLYDMGNDGISMRTYRAIADLMEEHNQYWTCTFGNHDSESYHGKADFLALLESYPHFIGGTTDGKNFKAAVFTTSIKKNNVAADNFVGNYSIPVYSAENKIAYNIYVLDSGSYVTPPPSGTPYLSITEEQTAWYAAEADKLIAETGAAVPSLLFTHIPFLEVEDAYDAGGLKGGDYVGISPSDTSSPILEECLKRGDMQAIFFGHNHENSATLVYEKGDKKLLFGVTPSCQANDYDDDYTPMGARIIDINVDGGLSTYVLDTEAEFQENIIFPA